MTVWSGVGRLAAGVEIDGLDIGMQFSWRISAVL